MILSDLACIHTCNAMVKEFKRKCVAAFSSLLNDEISKHVYDDDAPAGANSCVQRAKGPN